MASAATLQTARDHYRRSALTAKRATTQALAARRRGVDAVTSAVITHQVVAARQGEQAVRDMLTEQGDDTDALARLNLLAFTASAQTLTRTIGATQGDFELTRLVGSMVHSAGRAAESVSVAARPGVRYVRNLSGPSCPRCAVLAGRVYRYSTGFQRHPGCDCTMTPTTGRIDPIDPAELARQGQVRGLSKADSRALRDGADLGQVVNVRSKSAGLTESGRVLSRAGRPTPEGIYRMSSSQDEAVDLLSRFGYLR